MKLSLFSLCMLIIVPVLPHTSRCASNNTHAQVELFVLFLKVVQVVVAAVVLQKFQVGVKKKKHIGRTGSFVRCCCQGDRGCVAEQFNGTNRCASGA
jgi:hypothetical protein